MAKKNANKKPKAINPDKPKRQPPKRDPNAVKAPWNERMLRRVGRVEKQLTKIDAIIKRHPSAGASSAHASSALQDIADLTGDLNTDTAKAYKPQSGRHKVTIGAIIRVKADEATRANGFFARINPTTGKPWFEPDDFDGAEVIGNDRTSWMVTMEKHGGTPCSIAKSLVELVSLAPSDDAEPEIEEDDEDSDETESDIE